MPFKWGWGGQEVPDGVSKSLMVFHWSCLTTFVKGSPSRNGSNSVNTGVSLYPPNGVVEDRRFLMVVLSPGAGLEDGFRLLQTSKRPLLGWEIVNLPMVEKFGTWPLLTSCARMRARTHTQTHPKHMPTPWACVWAFTDLKKSYPGLRTKILKFHKFMPLLPHFSMEYNIAQLVWKALGRCAAEGFIIC